MPYRSEDLAYLAGIIDGEGCISIAEPNKRPMPGRICPYRYPKASLMVYNTNPKLLYWIQARFSGRVYWRNWPPPKKPCYRVLWQHAEMVSLLKELLPYLVLKKEQAEIVLAFQELKIIRGPGVDLKSGRTEIVKQQCHDLVDRIRILNRKGIKTNAIQE